MQDGIEAEHGHQDPERAAVCVAAPAPWRPHVVLLHGAPTTSSHCISLGNSQLHSSHTAHLSQGSVYCQRMMMLQAQGIIGFLSACLLVPACPDAYALSVRDLSGSPSYPPHVALSVCLQTTQLGSQYIANFCTLNHARIILFWRPKTWLACTQLIMSWRVCQFFYDKPSIDSLSMHGVRWTAGGRTHGEVQLLHCPHLQLHCQQDAEQRHQEPGLPQLW